MSAADTKFFILLSCFTSIDNINLRKDNNFSRIVIINLRKNIINSHVLNINMRIWAKFEQI